MRLHDEAPGYFSLREPSVLTTPQSDEAQATPLGEATKLKQLNWVGVNARKLFLFFYDAQLSAAAAATEELIHAIGFQARHH
jgi:hypothetical protein